MYNPKLTPAAQNLRRNLTKEERKLWYDYLRDLHIFKRQKVIGKYIVDFYCPSKRIVIELDGSQHYDEAGQASDKERDAYLKSLGIEVLRYSNLEINSYFEAVCRDITARIVP